jgi:CheY-like chemotaxis protein
MSPTSLLSAWTDHTPLALVVDVDADTRKLHAECLRLSAFAVEEAEDGREALAKAIASRPDVILTEVRLPGISGIELCELLRHDSATSKIPVVFVTGDAYQVKRAEAAGADAVLLKPCDPDSVLTEVCRVIDQPTSLRALNRFVRETVSRELRAQRSADDGVTAMAHRTILSRNYERGETTDPSAAPPGLVCPLCDVTLRYLRSYVGGVSIRHPEQWDYYECDAGCGTFQYRQRTRKLKKISG